MYVTIRLYVRMWFYCGISKKTSIKVVKFSYFWLARNDREDSLSTSSMFASSSFVVNLDFNDS